MNNRSFVAVMVVVFTITGLFAGIMPAAAQNIECPNGQPLVYAQEDLTVYSAAENGQAVASFGTAAPVGCIITLVGDMSQVRMNDGTIGWVSTENVVDVQPVVLQVTAVPFAPQAQVPSTGPENEDGDGQLGAHEENSFDVGVNEPGDTFGQIGYAWGSVVSWDGNLSEDMEATATMVTMLPGWYLDLTVSQDGGYRVYNYPLSWTEEQLNALTAAVRAEVLAGVQNVDMLVWDSDIESLSGSATGAAGVGSGDNYPQLDGQEHSCYPQDDDCTFGSEDLDPITVASERQFAIIFGAQISYLGLEGPHSNDVEESIRDPQYRCDIVVLNPGVYSGLTIYDGRVEVYNIPEFDQRGWSRNLLEERVFEQAGHYGCPLHTVVPIWNADGTTTHEYFLRWRDNNATVGGPREVVISG